MARGPGIRSKLCFCKYPPCSRIFKASREDAATCSMSCRKALNRLMGGSVRKKEPKAVTQKMNDPGPCKVYLNGRHVKSCATRDQAELYVAGMMQEWDGEWTIKGARLKRSEFP